MKSLKNKILRYFVGAAVCLSVMTISTSCDQLEDEFNNPDEMNEGRLDLFFTNALKREHLFRLGYGASYHHINILTKQLGLGAHAAFSFETTSNQQPQSYWTSWSGGVFTPFIFERTGTDYTVDINGMLLLYEDMSPEDQKIYEIFMLCARVVKSYAFQRSTDMYDDIPYKEAGGAFQEKFYPKYDTQEEIYDAILEELRIVSERLVEIDKDGLKPESAAMFNSSDVLNSGNVDKWLRFANSLRLRMAMRLVNVRPEESKALVSKLITENRLITSPEYDVLFTERDQNPSVIAQDLFFRGFEEMNRTLIAPQFILESIFHADQADKNKIDPRLYVLFQPNVEGEYVGFSTVMGDETYYRKYWKKNDAEFAARIDSIRYDKDLKGDLIGANTGYGDYWYTGRLISRYNRVTFLNYKMAFQVMQSTEVNLIIAEAAVRWPDAVKDAAGKVKAAIDASTRFYYNLNMNNEYNESTVPKLAYIAAGSKMTKLDESHLEAYLANAVVEFNSLNTKEKYKYIHRQKYVHNNILNPYESFSDARRLIKDLDGEIPIEIAPNFYWWERVIYPDSEAKNNAENYKKVAAKSRMTLPVWWSGRTKAAINPNNTPGVNLETDR